MKNLISKADKDKIDAFCKSIDLDNYTINSNGEVSTDESVIIWDDKIIELPLHFDRVGGNFNIASDALESLKGCPRYVGGEFKCVGNPITSLIGGPSTVIGDYDCGYNNITSLEGVAENIGGDLIAGKNREMISTYSGNTDIEIGGLCYINDNHDLPEDFLDYVYFDHDEEADVVEGFRFEHINIILKYQRHYNIWNDNLSLNIDNFNELMDEIKDGLE